MWLVIDQLYKENKIFHIYGKALFLAQKYENTCKEIIRWFKISEVLYTTKMQIDTNELKDYCSELVKISLGQTIHSLNTNKTMFKVTQEEIKILKDAKNSRNWIAHNSFNECILNNFHESKNETSIDKEFNRNIVNIISADYLVSKWSYEFYEKESGSFFSEEGYRKNILDWLEN